MKQLNESFQSQEIKNIIQNNEFFKYYIPLPFFTAPTLNNLPTFGEKHSNTLYYNIHYTIVKLFHTYLKLFNEETQDKFINSNTTAYFTKVIQLFNPRQYNKKQNTNLNESDRAKIYRDINIYVKQLYSLLQQVVNNSNYETTAINLLFRPCQWSNFRNNSWDFVINNTIDNMPTTLTKYNHKDMSKLINTYNSRDFDVALFYKDNQLFSIFNKTNELITNIAQLTDYYKKIYNILISNIKNIKIEILTTLDNYNILYLTNLKALFNNKDIDIKNMVYHRVVNDNTLSHNIVHMNDRPYDYALVSLNPKQAIKDPHGYYHYSSNISNINDYNRKEDINKKFSQRDYNKDKELISNIDYNKVRLLQVPISLSANINFCKECDNDYTDQTTGEIVHELLNTLNSTYSHYSSILNKYMLLYNKNQIKIKEQYDFNSAQKYVKYIGMYRNILEPLVQQVVDIMYTLKHNIPIDKKVLEDSDIKTERRNIENLTMELDKYRCRLLRFIHTVNSNIKIK